MSALSDTWPDRVDSSMRIDFQNGALVAVSPAIDRSARLDWRPSPHASLTRTPIPKVPRAWLRRREERDGCEGHHITLLHGTEVQGVSSILHAHDQFADVGESWIDVGLGYRRDGTADGVFKAVHWPAATAVREPLGLERKQVHVAVGFSEADVHAGDKGLDSLWVGGDARTALQGSLHPPSGDVGVGRAKRTAEAACVAARAALRNPVDEARMTEALHLCTIALIPPTLPTPDRVSLLDLISALSLKSGRYQQALEAAEAMMRVCAEEQRENSHTDFRAFIRVADAHVKLCAWAAACMAYWRAFFAVRRDGADTKTRNDVLVYIRKALTRCAGHQYLYLHVRDEGAGDTALWSGLSGEEKRAYYTLCRGIVSAMAGEKCDGNSLPPAISKTRQFVCSSDDDGRWHKLPRNFSWIVPFRLAVMSTPRDAGDVAALKQMGITLVVTATKETPLSATWFTNGIDNVFLPVENLQAPTIAQVEHFMRLCNQHLHSAANDTDTLLPAVLVHCGGGVGRAGTFAACYLARFGCAVLPPLCAACRAAVVDCTAVECVGGSCANATPPAMSAADAIEVLRATRPGSLETRVQEVFVRTYVDHCWKRYSGGGDGDAGGNGDGADSMFGLDAGENENMDIPSTGILATGQPPPHPNVLILVGLPGSGKSTFCARLGCISPDDSTLITANTYVRISQDDIGSRRACESLIATIIKRGGRVVLDRCNTRAADRMQWLELAFGPRDAVAVHFTAGVEVCVKRVCARQGHPTLGGEKGKVERVVRGFERDLEAPTVKEGFVGVWSVASMGDVEALAERICGANKRGRTKPATGPIGTMTATATEMVIGPSLFSSTEGAKRLTGFYKFPRTPHLFNSGGCSVSADDIVLSDSHGLDMLLSRHGPTSKTITIEEKIDGANLGITLGPRSTLLAQNRSHYVNRKSHPQFETINHWLHQHSRRLRRVLGDVPGAYVLYGEWMVAKHSIFYDRLPDKFIAFDILDVQKGSFLSRASFHEAIANANDAADIGLDDEPPLHVVPTVDPALFLPLTTKQEWIDRLDALPSRYATAQRAEGIYIRVDDGDWLKERVKLVRGDFICGNEHWTKHTVVKNVVLR
ncbi:uncharacterized protein EV422DRAFT_540078 [Fimicolochytrium jonesii]|uniref:uncharacterized protein n=1 Tax=Fimicolochytrium jonesii TaxID=1396493 RepID=UPI0022FEE9DC|nr:uncharacterized protein EV422DRAFT_540078 [Fimicolochytrium jonesii]KAI8817820.1 hypothetical protein EV422DRAFT_540078 [Fimicolochytrium jonesii]